MEINNFYMDVAYKTNSVSYYNDASLKDEWQNEVYFYAEFVAKQKNYKNVVDFGCGSAYKLIKYFNTYNTIGIDLPQTVEFLNKKYPNKVWQDNLDPVHCDIFMAVDVIEHMENPNILIDYIKKCNPKEIILSTPDRNLTVSNWKFPEDGPPNNIYHVREWNFVEFKNYISSHFDIVQHYISNHAQCTQLIHARIKDNE